MARKATKKSGDGSRIHRRTWVVCTACHGQVRNGDFERHRVEKHGFKPNIYEAPEAPDSAAPRTNSIRRPKAAALAKATAARQRRKAIVRSRATADVRGDAPRGPVEVPNRSSFLGKNFIRDGGQAGPVRPSHLRMVAARQHGAKRPRVIRTPRATFVSGGGGPGTGKRR